ncbi:MAG: hypothetical protein ACK4TK_05665 [Thiobacillaceae bacterium]
MLPEAVIAHRLPGRLRLRLDRQRAGPVLLAVAEKLQACPGIRSVTVNPLTGSLLILHATGEDEILRYAESHALFSVRPTSGGEARTDATAGLRALSQGVRQVTGGTLDLDGLLMLALTGLALQQAIEGNVMVPAAALLWNAYTLSRMPPLEPYTPQPDATAEGVPQTDVAALRKSRRGTPGAGKSRQTARKHRASAAR